MYRAVFLDIDGTLLNTKSQLEEETIEYINRLQNKGIIIGLASGRSLEASIIYGNRINCSYYVTYNGSLVFQNKKVIHDVKIPSKIAYRLCSKTAEYGGNYIHFSYHSSMSNNPLYEEDLLPFAQKADNILATNSDAHRITILVDPKTQ